MNTSRITVAGYIDVSSKHNKDYGPIFCTWIGTKGEVNLNTAETAEVTIMNLWFQSRN
jgi:hypothetical protein